MIMTMLYVMATKCAMINRTHVKNSPKSLTNMFVTNKQSSCGLRRDLLSSTSIVISKCDPPKINNRLKLTIQDKLTLRISIDNIAKV